MTTQKWVKTQKGEAVNIYCFQKMLFKRDSIPEVRESLMETYEQDIRTYEYRNLTFYEWLNEKRYVTAGILGLEQFA